MDLSQILPQAIAMQQHYEQGLKLATGLRERLEAIATGAPNSQADELSPAAAKALAKFRATRCKGKTTTK